MVAADVRPGRVGLVAANAVRTGATSVWAVVADGRQPAIRPGVADRVLVDAPCSGLGVLRRRVDARWRIQPSDIDNLAVLQRELLESALPLVRPGGQLIYSVCTLTRAESVDVASAFLAAHPELEALPAPGAPWREWGEGAILLPQDADTDGMCLFRWQVQAPAITSDE